MATSWMHFIGKGYYSIPEFIQEAKLFGVTRRVSLIGAGAASMSWGDKVICLQKEGNNKSCSVFCEFIITRFVGMSETARKLLAENYAVKQIDDEETVVDRECGSYVIEGTWEVDARLSEIAKKLQTAKKNDEMDIGKCMIGCWPDDITFYEKPYPKLGGFTQNQGFRAYNRVEYREELYNRRLKGKRENIKGTYYTKVSPGGDSSGKIQPVKSYIRKEDMDKVEQGQLVLL